MDYNVSRQRQLEQLLNEHAAEINRRRGEMAVAREWLDEHGIPKTRDGLTLTFYERRTVERNYHTSQRFRELRGK